MIKKAKLKAIHIKEDKLVYDADYSPKSFESEFSSPSNDIPGFLRKQ